MLVYDIEDFVLQVYKCIKNVAIKIHKDVSHTFEEMSIYMQGKYDIVKHASVALQKCIKCVQKDVILNCCQR